MYEEYNPNPCGIRVGDCVIRAISKLMNQDWEKTYIELCLQGLKMCDMPSSNPVWGSYLLEHGYKQVPTNPVTVAEFCDRHPQGKYLLATGSHVVTIEDGNYYDAWNSGNEIIMYYFEKEEDINNANVQ